MQFAPQIFQVMGMGVRSSLLSSMITNAVNMVATFVAIYVVDRSAHLSQMPCMMTANHGRTAQRFCKPACTALQRGPVSMSPSVSYRV